MEQTTSSFSNKYAKLPPISQVQLHDRLLEAFREALLKDPQTDTSKLEEEFFGKELKYHMQQAEQDNVKLWRLGLKWKKLKKAIRASPQIQTFLTTQTRLRSAESSKKVRFEESPGQEGEEGPAPEDYSSDGENLEDSAGSEEETIRFRVDSDLEEFAGEDSVAVEPEALQLKMDGMLDQVKKLDQADTVDPDGIGRGDF